MVNAELTRREFIGAGAAALLGAYGLSFAQAAAAQEPAIDSGKDMMLGLNTVHYNTPQVRQFVCGGNVDVLGLWSPPWPELEPEAAQLNATAWDETDQQVERARKDKIPFYIALWPDVPTWATKADDHAPTDTTPDGAWANSYVRLAAERYPDAFGLSVLDESNLEYEADPRVIEKTIAMAVSADIVLHNSGYGGKLYVPSTSDTRGFEHFINGFFHGVRNWQPLGNVALNHHAYSDIKQGTHWRTEKVLEAAVRHSFVGGDTLDATELGYEYNTMCLSKANEEFEYQRPLRPQEMAQLHHFTRYVHWAKHSGRVGMVSNYSFEDLRWGGGGFMSGLVRLDGKPHPLLLAWPRLRESLQVL